MRTRKAFVITVLILVASSSFGQQFTDLYGEYLGQTPPGDTPVVFARGIISTEYLSHSSPTFSPDCNEVYWWLNRPPKIRGENWLPPMMMTMRRVGDNWITPEAVSYIGAPFFSPDGKRLYFDSSQPITGGKNNGFCYIEKVENSWSEPKCVDLIARFPELQSIRNTIITRSGTLYFMAYLEGPMNNSGIYRSELINGVYAKPEPLSSNINMVGGILNWTPFVAPDESYLLFSSNRCNPESDAGDIYMCYRRPDGSWTDPVSLGEQVNSNQQERFPSVSPDGKWLFFTRLVKENDHDVFWVSASIIDRLREKSNVKK
jgi:hypothetical protein